MDSVRICWFGFNSSVERNAIRDSSPQSSCVLLVFALSLNGFPYFHRRHAGLCLLNATLLRLYSRS